MADVLITPASGKVEFKDGSNNVDGKIELDGSGNLNITAPGGDLVLGDTTSDIFIGNGVNNIDIVFEQSGEIRPTSGRTLTIGDTVGTLKLESDSPIDVNKEFKITSQGGINHVAHGIASGNTVANQLRSSWTAGFDRWYMYPIKDGASQFGRELTYYFDDERWAIEGPVEVGSLCALGNSYIQADLTVRGNLSISSTFTANTGIFTSGLTVNGQDILDETIFANGTISGQQGLTGSSFIVYDSSKSGVFHKDVSAGATSPVGPIDDDIVDGQVFKMVGNISHIEGHITGGTTLTLDFSGSKNIEVTGQTASGGRLDIKANSVTSDEILAGSITAGSLTVLALDYVNPVTKNKNLRGWGGADEVTGSATASAYVTYDDTEQALEVSNHVGSTNRENRVSVRSDTWQIDQNKIYRIAMDLKASGSANTGVYVGFSSFRDATEGTTNASESGDTLGGLNNIAGFDGTRTAITTGVNRYFYLNQAGDLGSYNSLLFYYIGANRSVDDCPQHLDPGNGVSGSNYAPFLQSTITSGSAEHGAIRILLWDSGTSQNASAFFKNISVTEVGTGQIVADNIVAGTITASRIAAGSLSAGNIAAGTITASRIAAGSLSAGNIAAGAITASRIATGSLSAGNIAAGTITASRIATGSLSAGNIAAGAISSEKLQSNSVSAGNIIAGTITASKIAANSLSAGNISAGAISSDKLQANSVSAGNIISGTITASKIATESISAGNIAAGTITGDKLVIGDVTNLVRNARFEDDRNEWTFGDEVTDATWGTALRLTATGGVLDSLQVAPYIPVTPGEKYYLSIQVRTDATGISQSSSGNVNVQYGFFEYATNQTTVTNYTNIAKNSNELTSSWFELSGVRTLQTDTYFIRPWVSVREGVASGNVYWSNFILRKQTGTVLLEDGAITADKIAVGAVTAGTIAANSISAGNIAAGAISSEKLQANSVSAGNIIAGTITASKIATGSLSAGNIAAGAISSEKLQANSVSAGNIIAGTITASKIATGSLSAGNIAAGAISSDKLQANSVSAGNIIAGTITASKIATGSLSAGNIAAGAISSEKLQANSVSAGNIIAGTITASRIAANSLSAGNIAAGTITASRIATNSLSAGNIAADSITASELAASSVTARNLVIGDLSNIITNPSFESDGYAGFTVASTDGWAGGVAAVTASSETSVSAGATTRFIGKQTARDVYFNRWLDVKEGEQLTYTLDVNTSQTTHDFNLGFEIWDTDARIGWQVSTASTPGNSWSSVSITRTMPANAARARPFFQISSFDTFGAVYYTNVRLRRNVGTTLIEDGSITTDKIQVGAITAGVIATNSLSAGNIAAGAITASRIATGSLSAGNIAAGAITASRIATNSLSAGNIAAGAITASRIATGSLSAGNIAAGAISSDKLQANSVSAGNIIAGTITASRIATNSLSAGNIAAGTITASRIATDSISAGNIAAGTITASRIATNSLSAGNIAAGAITASEIASDAIKTQNLYVTATNYVNPISTTKHIGGWAGVTDTSTTSPDGYVLYDASERALRVNNWKSSTPTTFVTNFGMRSDTWEADPNKIYRVDCQIKGVGGGAYYFGPVLLNNQTTGNEFVGGNAQGNLSMSSWNGSRAPGSNAPNIYFSSGNKSTISSYTDFTVYLIGFDRDLDDVPDHVGGAVPYVKAQQSASANWAIRFLNWSNSSASSEVLVRNISVQEVGAGQIVADNIKAGTITAEQIAAGAITSDRLQANSISAGNIIAGTITSDRLQANSISAGNIIAGTITASRIATDSLSAGNIAAGAITASRIATGSLSAGNIAAGAITSDRLQANSISAGNIISGTITASRIAANSLSAGNIAAGTITASRIATDSLSAGNIAAGAITASRIATGSLSAGNIAAGAITSDRLQANSISAGNIIAGTITASRIATNSLSAGNIAAGTITASRIATNSLSAGNIAAGTITSSRIATNSLSAGNIAANAITASELQISQSSGQNSIFFDGTNNKIIIKDQTSTTRVIIGKLT